MAIIEVQVRADRFCELVKGEINSLPLDKPFYDTPPEIKGKALERIVCTSCTSNDRRDDQGVTLDVELAFDYHDSLANVRNAGSLKPATPSRKQYPLRIRFLITFVTTPVRRPVLTYELLDPLNNPVKKGDFPIALPADLPVIEAAIRTEGTVVAIRLGTAAGDQVFAPVVDRTGGLEWMQHIPGDLIADTIRGVFDRTLDAAVVPPPPPDPNKPWLPKPKDKPKELRKEGPASASWNFSFATAFVMARGDIVAVDACPLFDVDIGIELTLVVTFEFPNPGTQRTRAVLTWDADSTWCDVLATLALGFPVGIAFHVGIENEVSDTILGKRIAPGDGFVETGRTDDSITFERVAGAPSPPSREFTITQSSATSAGLAVGGVIAPKVRANLIGDVTTPIAAVDIDCNLRTANVAMRPAKVFLRTDQADRLPRVFPDRVFEVVPPWWLPGQPLQSPDAWLIDVDTEMKSPASTTPVHVVLTFRDPPGGRLLPNTWTSVYLFTDYGVRWVDLGTIPALSAELLTKVDAHNLMNVYCDSISNPWAGGLTELVWVDPLLDPDYLEREVERGRLRLWTLGLRDLPDGARIELLAIGPERRERTVGVIEGRRDVALEVLTDANESLAVRTERGFTAPAPTLTESWFYPVSNVEMNPGAAALAAAPLSERLADEMANHERRGRLRWATAIRLQGKTLAAPHRGRMIVGTVVRGERVQ